MKNRLIILFGTLLALFLLANMLAFQVRYDEVAVLTTFGRAGEGSVRHEPGLYFRLPEPIQSVRRFPTRAQVLDDQISEVRTRDGNNIVLRACLVWRVDAKDPLSYFNRFPDQKTAEAQLRRFLTDLPGIISQYDLGQLVNVDPAQLKLAEVEAKSLERINERLAAEQYGIKVEQVGIRRLTLPQAVTPAVFERMRTARETEAARIRQEGEAEAARIQAEADAIARRITAYAHRTAGMIRAEGDRKAAEVYPVFEANQDFAIFLDQVETLKRVLKEKTTFLLDAQTSPMDLFRTGPMALPSPTPGTTPAPGISPGTLPGTTPGAPAKPGKP